MRYKRLYISLPFSAKQQREITKFCVFWRTQASKRNILDFLIELLAGITHDIWFQRFLGRFAQRRAVQIYFAGERSEGIATYKIRE